MRKCPQNLTTGLFLLLGCDAATSDVDIVDAEIATVEDCDDELAGDPDFDSDAVCEHGGDAYYWSPFQSVVGSEPGSIPLLDVKNDAEGRRYAAIRAYSVSADGKVTEDRNEIGPVRRGQMTDEHFQTLAAFKTPQLTNEPTTTVRPALAKLVAEADVDDRIFAHVNSRGPQLDLLQLQRNRAVAEGRIETYADARSFDREALRNKADAIRAHQDELLTFVEALGGEVQYRCEHASCFDVVLPASAVVSLSKHPEVLSMDAQQQLTEATNSINGIGIEHVYQTKPFVDHPSRYDGDSYGASYPVAVMELGEFRDDHPVFKEGSGSSTRILGRRDCNTTSCANVSQWTGPSSSHATASAGLVFGDLTDGQDSGVSSSADRRRRSGGGREARGWMYHLLSGSSAAHRVAMDSMIAQSPRPALVSSSIPSSAADPTCRGDDALSQDVDEILYENSTLMVVSAGNSGGTSSDCRVWSPGSALGAFTVGGWGPDANAGTFNDWCDARDATINSNSSWGGNIYEGRGRTIIDALGSYWHQLAPLSNLGYGTRNGTSVAAPAVAGAAVGFYDMYRVEHGSWVDDPGALFAWLLNMGDRDTSGVHIVEKFDDRWGAGRFRLRMLNAAGMDSPWGMYNIETCIDEGEYYTFDLNEGNALPNDVDSVRLVAYWYDRDFHDGGDVDDVDLQLFGDGTVLRGSYDGGDNKERVFTRGIGGKVASVRLYGIDVDSDDQGCGSNSTRVYLTVMYEDDDRDDGNGPSWNPNTCVGVDTW